MLFIDFIYLNDLGINLKFSLVSSTTGTKSLLSLYLWIPEFWYQVLKKRFTNKLARAKLIETFTAVQFQLLYLTLGKQSKVTISTTSGNSLHYSKSLCWGLKYSRHRRAFNIPFVLTGGRWHQVYIGNNLLLKLINRFLSFGLFSNLD